MDVLGFILEEVMITKCKRRRDANLVFALQAAVCISLIVLFTLEVLGKI